MYPIHKENLMSNNYINVSFYEKEEAKLLGARWDAVAKSWFVPDGVDINLFHKWTSPAATNKVATSTGTYNRGIKGVGGLYVDLVPSTCWYSNVRSMLSKKDWNNIRKKIYERDDHKCVICSGTGHKHPVEAHERWGFDEDTNTQYLMRIESLCPDCHSATHYGLAQVLGTDKKAFARLKYVNDWNDEETEEHIDDAFFVWKQRSNIEDWKLDISWLENFTTISNESFKIIQDLKDGKIERE